MDRRTGESPMDFEWQTRAPGDVTSPFYQLGLQHDQKKNHSAFNSPNKPQNQQFSFAPPTPQRHASPSRPNAIFGKPAFQTPRKFDTAADYSSGADSPDNNNGADGDEEGEETTPEQPVYKKEKRNSLFGLYGRFAPSPGRGGIPKVTRHTTDQARRVHKRRLRDRDIDRHLRRDSDYDIYDSDRPSSREGGRGKRADTEITEKQTPATTSERSVFANFFSFLNDHPNLPTIISYWVQLLWNIVIMGLAITAVLSFVWSIKTDIDHAADKKQSEILSEILECRERYTKNRCGGDDRPPALHEACTNWERCIDQDPMRVARATVSVQTISTILSAFVESVSLKAFCFFLVTVVTLAVVSNWSFVTFRTQFDHQSYPYASQQPPPQHYQNPPLAYPNENQNPYPNGSHYPLEYPQTPGRNDSPVRQRDFEVKQDENLLLEDTPSRTPFVTGRSRDREQHLHTPSPTKRDRFW